MKESIKNNETVQRLNTETSDYFKPFKYAGGVMLVAGVAIEVVALFTPAMPVAAVALAGKLLTIGGLLFGGSALTRNAGAKPTEKITVFGTIKNIFLK